MTIVRRVTIPVASEVKVSLPVDAILYEVRNQSGHAVLWYGEADFFTVLEERTFYFVKEGGFVPNNTQRVGSISMKGIYQIFVGV